MAANNYSVGEIASLLQREVNSFEDVNKFLQDLIFVMNNELEKIEHTFNELLSYGNLLREHNAVPARPKEGMLVIADGTNWNPGSGVGMYYYYGGAWVFIA